MTNKNNMKNNDALNAFLNVITNGAYSSFKPNSQYERRREDERRRLEAQRRKEEQRRAEEKRRQEERRRQEEQRKRDEQRRQEEQRRRSEAQKAATPSNAVDIFVSVASNKGATPPPLKTQPSIYESAKLPEPKKQESNKIQPSRELDVKKAIESKPSVQVNEDVKKFFENNFSSTPAWEIKNEKKQPEQSKFKTEIYKYYDKDKVMPGQQLSQPKSGYDQSTSQKAKQAIDSSPEIKELNAQLQMAKDRKEKDKVKQIEALISDTEKNIYYDIQNRSVDEITKSVAEDFKKNPSQFLYIAEQGAQKNPLQKTKDTTEQEFQNEIGQSVDPYVSAYMQLQNAVEKEYTDEELMYINYLYGSGREAEAKALKDAISRNVNERFTKQSEKDLQQMFGTKDGQQPTAAQRAGAVATNLLMGAQSPGIGVLTAGQALIDKQQGGYTPPDVNSPDYFGMKIKGEAENAALSGLSGTGRFLASTGMSILESALTIPLTGPAAPLVMGAKAAGQSSYEAIQAGADYDQAAVKGLIDGSAEALMEKIPTDNLFRLFDIAKQGKQGIKTVVKETVKQAGMEATEEALTEVVNILSDASILKDKGDISKYLSDYITNNPNATKADENSALALYVLERIGSAAAGGALSGGVMGGGAQVAGSIQISSIGSQVKKTGTVDYFLNSALAVDDGTESSYIAKQIQKTIQEGKQPSNYEVGQLVQQLSYKNALDIMEKTGKKPTYNPGENVTLQDGEEVTVLQKDGDNYLVDTTQGEDVVTVNDIVTKTELLKAVTPIGNTENSLIPYTKQEISNLHTGNNYIDGVDINTKEFIEKALSNNIEQNAVLYMGKVPNNIAQEINSLTGNSVDGYSFALTNNEIRKIIKDHGNPDIETPRGQIPVTPDILSKIRDVVENPESIKLSNKDRFGKPVLQFEKRINGYSVYLQVVSDKGRRLSPVTFYVINKKSPTTVHAGNADPVHNALDASGTTSLNESVPYNYSTVNEGASNVQEAEVLTSLPDSEQTSIGKTLQKTSETMRQLFVDAGAPFDRLGRIVGDEDLYKAYNMVRHAKGIGSYMIGGELADGKQHGGQTDFNGNIIGESLTSIFDPVQKKGEKYTRDFYKYLFHMHNIDRMAQDKPVFGKTVTADDSIKIANKLLANNPEFKEIAEKVWKFNDNNLQYRVDSGLLSQEQAGLLREMYPHYVPTYRDLNSTKGASNFGNRVKINTGIKTASGGNSDLLPIYETMARQTMQMAQASELNMLGNRLYDDVISNIDNPKITEFVNSITVEDGSLYDIDSENKVVNSGNDTFIVYKNGSPITLKVSENMGRAISALTPKQSEINKIINWFSKFNSGYKSAITAWNPFFLITNMLKDIQDGMIWTENLGGFLKKYPKAYAEIAKNGDMWQKYLAAGGITNSFFEDAQQGFFNKKRNGIKKYTLDKLEFANLAIEQAPRLSEFMTVYNNSINQGMNEHDAIRTAIYAADEVTTNFGRSGSATAFLNKTFVPFLNPSVQGADKIWRTIVRTKSGKGWATLAIRSAMLGVIPAIFNALLYGDDEEYKNMPVYIKDNYWLFKKPDGKYLRIPRGRFSSIVVGFTNRIIEAASGQEPQWEDYFENVINQVGPVNPIESNILSPILGAINNKSWTGKAIESNELQRIADPAYRFDERTSEIAKAIGQAFGVSPKKVDYLIDQYTGVFGDILQPLTTQAAERNIVSQKFEYDPVLSNTLSDSFYSIKDNAIRQQQEIERTNGKSEVATKEDLQVRYLNKVNSDVGDLYDSISIIQNDVNLTDKEKLDAVRDIRININALYKMAIDTYPEVVESLGKNYVVNQELSETQQKKQVSISYAKAITDVFGVNEGMQTYGKEAYEKALEYTGDKISMDDYFVYYTELKKPEYDEYKNSEKKAIILDLSRNGIGGLEQAYSAFFEDKDTPENKTIEYAAKNGVRPSIFVEYKSQPFNSEELINDEDGTKQVQAKKWILENALPEEMATLYEMTFQKDEAKEESTIKFAESVGVRPDKFIERDLQNAQAEGDEATKTDLYYDYEGNVVSSETGKKVSGTVMRDSMQSLLDGGYTEEEKKYFYQKEHGGDDSFVWAMLLGAPVDAYLTVKRDAWDFGEKDANGKTISGTKKADAQATLEAAGVDSLMAEMLMKLGVSGSKYKMSYSGRNAAVEYINSLQTTDENKEELFRLLEINKGSGGRRGRRGGGRKGKSKVSKISAPTMKAPKTAVDIFAEVASGKSRTKKPQIKVKNTIIEDTLSQEVKDMQKTIFDALINPTKELYKEKIKH